MKKKGKFREGEEVMDSYKNFHLWRAFDLAAAVCSLLGILCASVEYELKYPVSRDYENCENNTSASSNFNISTFLTTFFSIVFILCRYYYKNRWLKLLIRIERNYLGEIEYSKRYSKRRLAMVREILVLLIFPYPYLDTNIKIPLRYDFQTVITCYKLNELLYCFMFFRCYFLIRAISNYSIFQNQQARIYCRKYNIQADLTFSFKCLLNYYPMYAIFAFGAGSVFFTSIICRVFERPLDMLNRESFANPLDALWFIFETISTLGYGDYTPISYMARISSVFAFFLGSIAMSFLISTISGFIELSNRENLAFEKVRRAEYARELLAVGIPYLMIRKKYGWRNKATLECFYEVRLVIDTFKFGEEKEKDKRTEEVSELVGEVRSAKVILKACSRDLDLLIEKLQAENKNL